MSIKVQYFASLKELTNHSDLEVAFTQPVTVVNLWSQINPDVPLPEKHSGRYQYGLRPT